MHPVPLLQQVTLPLEWLRPPQHFQPGAMFRRTLEILPLRWPHQLLRVRSQEAFLIHLPPHLSLASLVQHLQLQVLAPRSLQQLLRRLIQPTTTVKRQLWPSQLELAPRALPAPRPHRHHLLNLAPTLQRQLLVHPWRLQYLSHLDLQACAQFHQVL